VDYEHVAIEGNIGVGKSTLAGMLAEAYGGQLLLEAFEDNPFLPKFYQDPERNAFPVELYFLAERYQQLKGRAEEGRDLFKPCTFSDHFIQKSLIFAGNNLEGDEYRLFDRLFRIMYESLPKPDLVLYLHKDPEELQRNIGFRGREFEKGISSEYLQQLQDAYFSFFKQHPELRVVILDISGMDFVANDEDYEAIRKVLERSFPKGISSLSGENPRAEDLKGGSSFRF
jgi:deoxyadenosine/deoxycytidine kinase